MKSLNNRLLLLILVLNIVSNASVIDTVEFAIGEWVPYTSSKNANGKIAEIIVKESMELEGIAVHFSYYPWKRSYMLLEVGQADASFPWVKDSQRIDSFYFNKTPILEDEHVYFHLKSSEFDWQTIADLKKFSVGVTIGYYEEQLYKDNGINAQPVVREELNFEKIFNDRIDVYRTSKLVGYSLINKLYSPDDAAVFIHHPKVVDVAKYFVMFSKKTDRGKRLADKFDSGLNKLKKSGRYDKILGELLTTSSDILTK